MSGVLPFSYRSFRAVAMVATVVIAVTGVHAPANALDSYGAEQEVPFSLNPPVAPEVEAPVRPDAPYPPAQDAERAAPAAPKDWSDMDLATLKNERARLEVELEREGANHSPTERKKMRNLLKRIESEISRKSLEPSADTRASEETPSANEKADKAESKVSTDKTDAKPEKTKEKVKTPKEKIRDTIYNRRYRTKAEEPEAEASK